MNVIPVGLFDLERVEAGEARGVIDQAVEASEMLRHLVKEAGRISVTLSRLARNTGDVAAFRHRRGAGFGFRPAIVNRHARALRRQRQRDASGRYVSPRP